MLEKAKNMFFLGIKGVAMANLAVFFKKSGKNVTGVDSDEEFITDRILKDNDIDYLTGISNSKLPKNIDLFIYSAAHGGVSNHLAIEAKKRGITLMSQADLLGEMISSFENKIAVTGCHGKTTTSSLLAYSLNKLGAKPSYLVGVPFFTDYPGVDLQDKKYFVIEADEYGVNPPLDKTPKFFKLDPDYIIATNIDFDHPDVYKDIEETKKAFLKFFSDKKLILRSDNAPLMEVASKLKRSNYTTCGYDESSDYIISNPKIGLDSSTFDLLDGETKKNIGTFHISLFGRMNIANAAVAVVMLMKLGFKAKDIATAIRNFTGSERRFETIYRDKNFYLLDDYAHHPSEIATTIKAAKERFKDKRILVIFQPHTFTRTASLLGDFSKSLSLAEKSFILPIFASARENREKFNITSQDIVERAKTKNLFAFTDSESLLNELKKIVEPGDIVFTMGAGDVYKLKDKIIEIMKAKGSKESFKVERNKDISVYLTLRTKVRAQYFIEAKTREDLVAAKKYSLENNIPMFVLGGGSNLAITKPEIKGLVVKNNYRELRILEENKKDVLVSVSSGYAVSLLIAKSISYGWSGFEYHQGLPGTIGGGICMNSKWTKPMTYFGDNLVYAYLIDSRGNVKKVDNKYFNFAYDYSKLQDTKEIVLEAVFRLKKDASKEIAKRAKEALEYRKRTQPYGVASSGCFFKNISLKEKDKLGLPTTSAGYLIDQAGMKNKYVGKFYVSPVHANFIINKGGGKREDLIKLLSLIKQKVRTKFGVNLEEEVIII